MEDKIPSHELTTVQPQWAQRTMEQLKKDADLSGFEWTFEHYPMSFEAWIQLIVNNLNAMEKQNPELIARFLYRVDLSEKKFLQHPEPNPELAEAILKRTFLKVWFKAKYK